jgi:methyl-accepting chemotaxis protein
MLYNAQNWLKKHLSFKSQQVNFDNEYKNPMKPIRKENLQRTMIIYFLLIVCASLLVTIEFVFDVQSPELKNTLLANFEQYAQQKMTKELVFVPLAELKNKAILMIAIIMYVTIIVLTMLIKNITGPLQHMIDVSQQISEGDLTKTIQIRSNNELAQLGKVINEMASNLQEVTVLSQNMSSTGAECLEKVRELLMSGEITEENSYEVLEELEQLQMSFEMLQEFTECFRLYEVEGIERD